MEAEAEIHEEAEVEIREEAKEMGSRKPKQTAEARATRPPHNYVPIETSSLDNLCHQLYGGVVLQQGKRKYWVDRHLNKNCFMVFARELAIKWGDSNQYWGWTTVKESGNVDVEVAELRSVCWLEISGKFRTIMLSPKTSYEVSLVALMTESSRGWGIPVNISIALPDKSKLERVETLQHMPQGKWINILMGKFMVSSENIGEITFCISEYSSNWKEGLVVKGVAFQPKD